MRRDNLMYLQKRVKNGVAYHSVVLKFSQKFLKEFYRSLNRRDLPFDDARRERKSLRLLPRDRADIKSLFESLMPFFESGQAPSADLQRLKMTEGLYVLLNTDVNLYASLFDFVEPWKIDIIDYLNENFAEELSMEEIARNTGRSLATFKRAFKKYSDLTPQKWIIRKRLEVAHRMISEGKNGLWMLATTWASKTRATSRVYIKRCMAWLRRCGISKIDTKFRKMFIRCSMKS